jgi:hypothetical protein
MSASIFTDKNLQPDDQILFEALGETNQIWEEINKHLKSVYGELVQEWKFYGKNYGWQLKTLRKKRNLFFIIPHDGYFTQVFVFGDKAVSAIDKSDLPDDIKETLRNAKKYAEGRGYSIDVKSPEKIEIIKKLVEIKINN